MPMMTRGDHHTDATKAKIAEAHRGNKNHNYGKPRDPETCKKISITKRAQKVHASLETKTKMSLVRKGRKFSQAHRSALAARRIGYHHTEETKKKLSAASSRNCGEKASNWQGGLSFEPYCPKFNEDLKRRVRAYFENRCILCGMTAEENSENLSVHHVTYDKMICCNGKPVQFAALCHGHHTTTNYDRPRWEAILHRIIDEIYGGRSYYTKNEWKEATACDST